MKPRADSLRSRSRSVLGLPTAIAVPHVRRQYCMTPQLGTGVDLGEVYHCAKLGCPNLRGTLFSWGGGEIPHPNQADRIRVNK